MKKLMTMIAAVATAFGLYAEDAVLKDGTSFETDEAGVAVTGETWAPPAESVWSSNITDAFDLDAYTDAEKTALPYTTGAARRDEKFQNGTTNDKYLKLETGSETLDRSISGQVYFDQLVKFTGFEEEPTFGTTEKIAVWMSGFEGDDDTVTNDFYVAVGDGLGGVKNVKLDFDADPEDWYRVTIKQLSAGFRIWINGAPVAIVDKAKYYEGDIPADVAPLYDDGLLFMPINGATAVSTVSYKGLGAIDDVVMSIDAPDFDSAVNVTVEPITGAIIVVKDAAGNEIKLTDSYYSVPRGAFTVTYTADEDYILTGAPIVKNYNTADTTEVDDSETVKPQEVVVEVEWNDGDDSEEFASLGAALAKIEELQATFDEFDVAIKKDCAYEIANVGMYSFTADTMIGIVGTAWTVNAKGGVVTNTVGTVPGKQITVTNGKLALAGMIMAGDDKKVASITADEVELVGNLDVGILADSGLLGAALTITEDGKLDAGEFQIKLYSTGAVYFVDEGALITDEAIVSAETGKVVVYNAGVYSLVEEAADVVEIVGTGAKYKSLAAALEAAQKGDELKLLADITLTETATVDADITLNLNGKTITGSWNTGIVGVSNRQYIFELGDSAVTVKGGTVSSTAANIGGFHTVGGALTIAADAVVDTAWRAVGVYSGATLTVAEGATLKTANVDPTIMVIANGVKTTLNINGIVQNTCSAETKAAADRPHNLDAAIMGSGNDTATDIVAMNIGATAQISATAAAGIYAPNAGTVTVADGARITGFTYGIYAKSGNLVINGGTITATADTAVAPTAFNDGVNGQGYAVLLETGAAAGGYANNLVADIQGGKFTSTGAAVYNFDRSAAGDSPIAACISGGLFKEKPADALLAAPTTAGYKAVWVADETVTGYWKPGTEVIEYTITYNYTDDQGEVKEIKDLYPNEYDVEDAGILPLPTEMPAGFTGGELEAWYTTAELTGEPVSVIPAGSIGEKTFWAKLKSVVDPVEEEIEANVNTEGLDDAAKAKVYENTVKLNTACGGDDKAMAWMTAVYGNQKVPGAKLAATTDDLIAISVKYLLPILGKEPTVEIAAATEGEGFTFQIKDDGTPVSLEAAKENIIKMVEFTDELGTKEFADATANDITVTASGNTATAAFTKKTDAGFMRVNLKK